MPRTEELSNEESRNPGSTHIETEWAYGWLSDLTNKWYFRTAKSFEIVEEELEDLRVNRGISGADVVIMSRQRRVEVSEWYRR